ncbi:substrate-binding domain-containing protein [Muricomes intestini]|uniref:substrate-binding domain-containing protein n=1 Tax=Muricomes intestini TaxID=1796634 RepID=UPI002FE29771
MKRKVLSMLMAVVMVAGILTGCGGSDAASTTTDTEETTEAAEGGDTAAAKSDIKVAYLAKNIVDAFAVTMNTEAGNILDGMVEEGLISEWQLFDANTDVTLQVSSLEDAINSGFNFVILQPCEGSGSDPVVTRCNELNIPIVVINSYTDSTMEKASGYAGSYDVQAGEIMGNYIKESIPDGGLFVHMMGVVGNTAQVDRGAGIANTLTEEDGWTNGGDYAAEWLAEKAVGFATDAVTTYGDELKAIVCDNDDMSSAVQAYCNSVNREDIVCIGVDGTQGPLTMVKEGTLGATILQDGAGQVDYAIDTIARAIMTGKTDGVEMFKTDIPFILVTQDNVDEYLK